MPGTVTVIIPHYNHGHLLPRTIAAYAAQTLPAFEVLIVDDVSTDGSDAVAEELSRQYPNIRLIRRARNGGPNAAIVTGLAEARSDFVTFSAADDFVEPEFLSCSVEALLAHPQAAFSFLDPSRRFVDSNRIEEISLALAPGTAFFSPDEFVALFRHNSFTISSNTVVYRRPAIQEVGGFRADLEWQADWMANLVLAFRHGAIYVPRALAHFVVNPKSYGESGVRSSEGQRRLLGRCLKAIHADYPDVERRFRDACLLPEMRLRTLFWLMQSDSGRAFLHPRMALRLLQRELWTQLRPFTPVAARRWLRRQVARLS